MKKKKVGDVVWEVQKKTMAIFRELLDQRKCGYLEAQKPIAKALNGDRYLGKVAQDIAIHLVDWQFDGLIIVAITMFPERFTQEEIRRGVIMFLVHAPDHIAAAAKLGGWPVKDIFEVGALDGREDS